ncbi:SDR family NAD(P)-dependent oxidoreductase [Nannocystis punicea]|uniref:SDR family NAD(P)-dependent oxidoreductase n=1 Tax=Nannocystis punicea TaxID=2995304 RepID=A0ABY7HG44_9BACT|nr:SDR family NAD(P)-dependent oxidoreductase [Nannocystis poenicansa]WAS98030.1 SDR family NAD(P)-dependent oxidoreductase [Nannocystis poenicansa]
MDLELKGKRAIVTGGSAGIGLAVVRMLAEEGVRVTVPGRNHEKLMEALASVPGAVRGLVADLTTRAGAEALVRQEPETDILVNNLGIYESKDFADIRDDDWLRYFEVNLLGGIRLARHYFPGMLARDWGRVVFVSSEAAVRVHPDMIHYGVTKAGQLVVSRGLAELTRGTGVTVNAVLPGPTRSGAIREFLQRRASTPDATPEQAEREYFQRDQPNSLLQRMAEDREIASLIVYLASPLAAATNGAALRCDGGIVSTIL